GFLGGLFSLLAALAVGLGILGGGALLLAAIPRRLTRIEATLTAARWPSCVVGGLSAVLLLPLWALAGAILSITFVGPFVVSLLVGLILLIGLTTVGLALGTRLVRHGPLATASNPFGRGLLGLAVLLLLVALPTLVLPWLGAPLLYLLSCLGLGATILS